MATSAICNEGQRPAADRLDIRTWMQGPAVLMLLHPRVGRIDGAGVGQRPCPTTALECRLPPHPPHGLAASPDLGEGCLADVAGVEGGAEEAARVDIALHRDGANVLPGTAGVAGVDVRLPLLSR